MSDRQNPDRSSHQCVCPWWCCFTFDNFLRKLVQDPDKILKLYVRSGWTALDVGPGMGYFTLALARLVGPSGTVIAADLQAKMLNVIQAKAERAGLIDRIKLVQSSPDRIGIERPLDFALAFWMVHEVPDRPRFFKEIVASLKKDGLLLLVEPRFHVSRNSFAESLGVARDAGLTTVEQPSIFLSRAALLKK